MNVEHTPPEKQPDLPFLLARPAHFLALGFGAGLARKAPGTWGTLATLPIYFAMAWLPAPAYWALAIAFVGVGVWFCDVAGKALGIHDHGSIVWDEIAAFLLVLPFAPATWWGYLLAFALFRLFDIWKPFPINWLDAQVKGGLGVMLDDLLAAGYAIVVLLAAISWR
ncbi:MAG: phosphatidylglycerophosphatase A [Hydrogenophilales bacterium CG03_land_8_20_14_0_80_62_28]|nr:phosphatidylglycerophosphatase A [Betaproteobacteria bacterium]OIO78662.1 MAG: phosphatidylglycerophosphatase A [Hydrogenophilaceae bacterium CG1_02_62_390]PIV22431.1 MAG: phosphatidylglycerophosphatase A [Hydrogenophilales bacterium CG03_land_8_20_14_0_80_62_28]PIW38091.1 MAG: phosphatidylglycerophosphatase A [Hydrogenophilales bacterium CG15_BIG_FIL_POST_REV_8_21_14_020_62_31]PIW72834.1 MAG: phosphatidylglycerophosphatase A [Hydrogenophilales bacterium CG12_big_fil_rev_8_21_14_0_65_61_21]